MLFGSIVFMNRTLRGQCITFIFVFILKLNISPSLQIPRSNGVRPPDDFEGFLQDLGTMVYKSKRPPTSNDLRGRSYTTPPYKNYRRSQNTFKTQKTVLGDVLMMKLVSYYEDKYKLTHLEPTTTESITFMRTFTHNAKGNFENLDGGLFDKGSQNRHYMERNRRMETPQAEVTEDDIPEVVIL